MRVGVTCFKTKGKVPYPTIARPHLAQVVQDDKDLLVGHGRDGVEVGGLGKELGRTHLGGQGGGGQLEKAHWEVRTRITVLQPDGIHQAPHKYVSYAHVYRPIHRAIGP